jgi:hypothetical protein
LGSRLLLLTWLLGAACTTPRNELDVRDAASAADAPVVDRGATTSADAAVFVADTAVAADQPVMPPPALASNGQACADGTQCASSNCVDGVCCDLACRDVCRACAVPDHAGVCTPVTNGVDSDTCSGADSVCAGADVCAAIDQRQDTFPFVFDTGDPSAISSTAYSIHAQTITPGRDGRVAAVRLKGHCDPSALFTLQIQAVANGQPNGVMLGSRTLPAGALPGNNTSPQLVVLGSPVLVKAGVPIAIVLRASQGLCRFTASNVDAYPGGNVLVSNQGQLWLAADGDMTFQTFVAPVP